MKSVLIIDWTLENVEFNILKLQYENKVKVSLMPKFSIMLYLVPNMAPSIAYAKFGIRNTSSVPF